MLEQGFVDSEAVSEPKSGYWNDKQRARIASGQMPDALWSILSSASTESVQDEGSVRVK